MNLLLLLSLYEAWNPDCWAKLRSFELVEAEK